MSERRQTRLRFASAALFAALLLIVANLYTVWRPWTRGVVTAAWPRMLWAVNLSLSVRLVGNLALALWRSERLRLIFGCAFALCSFILSLAVVQVFPFELSRVGGPWLDFAARVVAMIGVGVGAIGLAISTLKLVLGPKPPSHRVRPAAR
jgi:hypothetical protein